MAVQQVCTFYLEDTCFGLNIEDVQEIIRAPEPVPVPLAPADVDGLINLRGQIITVINLKQRLKLNTHPASRNTSEYNIVIRLDNETVSLGIDRLDDILDFSDAEFEPPPATLQGTLRPFLQGAYPLIHQFVLVLDPAKILEA